MWCLFFGGADGPNYAELVVIKWKFSQQKVNRVPGQTATHLPLDAFRSR